MSKQDQKPKAEDMTPHLQALAVLGSFPQLGRPGSVEGTREWSTSGLPYVGADVIQSPADLPADLDIIAVIRTSRRYPFSDED